MALIADQQVEKVVHLLNVILTEEKKLFKPNLKPDSAG